MTEIRPLQPDRRKPEPLWHQVERSIRQRIEGGEWPTGSRIPAEDRLCGMLGVSRITIRHAIRNLEEAGLLRREHGRGTFVRNATLVAGTRDLTSFTDEMSRLGRVAGSEILEAVAVQASPEVATALGVADGTPIVRVCRLRKDGDTPIGVQTANIPAARVPGFLDGAPLDGSLYLRLRERYAIAAEEAHEVYRVTLVGEKDAALLDVAVGSPAFVIERVSADARGPFEFTVSLMRGDLYEIRATLRT
ncbi:MAG: GntR family transcriptional regulator [Hyphomicrobiales bacterium]|nr:GntR family transcriptional regulator [Hyphomicrobiales bacterium]